MSILKKDIADIQKRKPPAVPYKLSDGGGLYLYVTTTGSLLWRYDYRRKIDGKRKTMSLGEYGDTGRGVDLDKARLLHHAARIEVKNGGDPAAKKTAERDKEKIERLGTFGGVADEWLKTRTGNKAKTSARDQRSVSYLKDGYRRAKGLGGIAITDVKLIHLSPLLREFNKPTRVRVQSAAKKIVGFAKVHGLIDHSPFSDINFEEGFAPHKERKRPAITDEKELGTLLRKMDEYEGRADNLTHYALQLLALTFVRPGTVQSAEWKHFDLKNAQWVVPFGQLKMEHLRSKIGEAEDDFVVPLSRQALKLLRELHEITGDGRYLFPGSRGSRPISENTLNYALWGLGYKGIHCAHGFRSSASTILNRQRVNGRRRFERSLVELQLDHQDQTVRAIYDRDDCLPERIELMQFWADKLDELRGNKEKKKPRLRVVA